MEDKWFSFGTFIELLKLFHFSVNAIVQFFEKLKSHNTYKNKFIEMIIPKYERELNSEYDYSFSEIFDNNNDREILLMEIIVAIIGSMNHLEN